MSCTHLRSVLFRFLAVVTLAVGVGLPGDAWAGEARTMRVEVVLDVPLDVAWWMWTTKAGIELWMVPKAAIDLKNGGTLRTTYNPDLAPGDLGSIEHRILAYDPLRMFSMRTVKSPAGFPHKQAIEGTYGVTTFERVDDKRTRVRMHSIGWGRGAAWDAAWAFFEKGNAWTLQQLKQACPKALELAKPAKPNVEVVETSHVFDHEPDLVWRVFATKPGLEHWHKPGKVEIDLRVGGALKIEWSRGDQLERIESRVLTCDPGRLLVLSPQKGEGVISKAYVEGRKNVWMIAYLEPLEGGKTLVVMRTVGQFGEGDTADQLRKASTEANWTALVKAADALAAAAAK